LRRNTASQRKTITTRLFLDASVVFSASYSEKGASREIILRGIRGQLIVVVSRYVLKEVRVNLEEKAPHAVEAYQELVTLLSPEIADAPSLSELREAATYINLKDAPIVAAAARARVDYLVTLDRKHLLSDPKVAQRSGLKIVTPDQLMAIFKDEV